MSINQKNLDEWIVPVTWKAYGFIKVRAKSAEETVMLVHNNPDNYLLPYESNYVDSSFDISSDIEESIALSTMFTNDYKTGKLII